MKITAKEIRLGNFLQDGIGDFLQDDEIFQVSQEFFILFDLNLETSIPIPITKEWLLKLGFVKLGDGFEFWKNSVFNIEFINDHWHVCYTSNVLCTHLKHVHQLQNLYFALTGEELTLKD